MKFSEHLVFLREKKNVLQKDLAEIAGVSLHTYQRYEYGEREPQLSALIALADFYDLSLDELVCRKR
nr:helix-turn-helix transcriptional regulator [uncultured Dysosmobacter sp.]